MPFRFVLILAVTASAVAAIIAFLMYSNPANTSLAGSPLEVLAVMAAAAAVIFIAVIVGTMKYWRK